MFHAKDPRLVEAGKRGAMRRWGVPKTVRLDDLDADQRRLVLAMIEAAKATAKGQGDAS